MLVDLVDTVVNSKIMSKVQFGNVSIIIDIYLIPYSYVAPLIYFQ